MPEIKKWTVNMEFGQDRAKTILRILKDEYGITTEKELDRAIKKMEFINLTPFIGRPKSASQPTSHSEQ